ncbi:MAG TPA: GTP cyclohydrolase I FolE2 [Deltaproteobacteria bacterium]|nr:MAG: GTP cyclohydrolase [Deltaproteobacteria bacterium GWB2_42_7]OGP44599.1 MAG: GTP cyclohydrolase [Deltaproteobacteria bacterium GWD2_42_10]OGP46209.1 MAG: GTP cyclohydrolase [Deltaproteobacteria bacterium GWF2_42_12]OGQ35393.1 MAG: GTP cyclohydrolase [Deltaproteobacteria bacterium RIFCSPLOWO2_02_FULL_42_39]OGQ66494.1 MAG: GTP cyclohydrolase [Deltaproteobacteria bacterium RIFCSPLOWO2_12_FULL_42_16]OGQ75264.1 MAG: GTP cyclohydrolase [Deltaproteobacteria bacterium RIFOXYA2_FULL_42_10]HAG50
MGKKIKDIQSLPDFRQIAIDKVGVKDIRYPIVVLDKKNKFQHTIGSINMYVDLPHHFKGTHMSRFVEILNEHRGEITVQNFPEILAKMKKRFNAETAHMGVEFPYFIEKAAPVSKAKGLMEYRCRFAGSLRNKTPKHRDKKDFILEVIVPVATLCPCSKEISRRGAHNQRGMVKVAIRFHGFVWIEDIIKIVETSASSPVYSLLKRPDEKYVTEHAYDNPRFVEDVVREIASRLEKIKPITWFSIEAENWESIHNHSAYAYLERKASSR